MKAGGKAFSAGADVVALRQLLNEGKLSFKFLLTMLIFWVNVLDCAYHGMMCDCFTNCNLASFL